MSYRERAEELLLYKCLAGSHAYGMATPKSDLDVRGVFAADQETLLSPFFNVEQIEGEGDTVFFELSKYVRLLADQNPSILELLWTDESDILLTTPAWQILRENRERLLTTKLRATFGGYALSQLKKMKSHEKWINNPQPETPPVPKDYMVIVQDMHPEQRWEHEGLPREDALLVGIDGDLFLLFEEKDSCWFDDYGALRSLTRKDAAPQLSSRSPSAVLRFDRRSYDRAKKNWDHYWHWKRNRFTERRELEEQRGYDTKNASHLIRLLRTGRDALRDGVLTIKRPDAEELLSIRRGEWSYEAVVELAESLDCELGESEENSPLARKLDESFLADLTVEIYRTQWSTAAARSTVSATKDAAPSLESGIGQQGRLVVIDVEGTGYQTHDRRICEIAAVEVIDGERTGRVFHAFVNPGAAINRHAQRVHGLSGEFLARHPEFSEMAEGLLEFVGNAPIIAHDAVNDRRSLNHDLAAVGMPSISSDQFHCTKRMARILLGESIPWTACATSCPWIAAHAPEVIQLCSTLNLPPTACCSCGSILASNPRAPLA